MIYEQIDGSEAIDSIDSDGYDEREPEVDIGSRSSTSACAKVFEILAQKSQYWFDSAMESQVCTITYYIIPFLLRLKLNCFFSISVAAHCEENN